MKNLSAFTLGALPFACLLFACSSAPESDKTHTPGVGPIDGEIPGQGNGSGAASGAIPSPGSGGSGGPVGVGGSAGAGGSGGAAGSGGAGAAGGGGGAVGGAGTGATGGAGGAPPEPGTLTAGAWDDNRNFDRFLGYRSEIAAEQSFGMLGFSVDEHRSSHDMSTTLLVPHELLDVALVIDTTGSMGDEIEYLKSELIAISGRIAALHPQAAQRWSLIVYRDSTDEYVVRWFGFREGVQEIQTRLAEQRADGGGDFPEAPDAAFRKLNELYWRAESNVARLAFWIADAPHHAQNAENFSTAVRRTRELGIRVYPIASSGIDGATELTMRSVAQITGGRYLFLTDDSGVGGPHLEPSIPCYFVTKLDDAMVRMVDIEMSGTYHEPAPDQILRTGGDPENGACRLDSGAVVAAY